jgi:hypothetical protein
MLIVTKWLRNCKFLMNPQAKLGLTVDSKDSGRPVASRNQQFASPSLVSLPTPQLFKWLLALRVVAICKVIVKPQSVDKVELKVR